MSAKTVVTALGALALSCRTHMVWSMDKVAERADGASTAQSVRAIEVRRGKTMTLRNVVKATRAFGVRSPVIMPFFRRNHETPKDKGRTCQRTRS